LEAISGTLKVAYLNLAPIPMPEEDTAISGLPRWDRETSRVFGRHREAERKALRQLRNLGFESIDGNVRFKLSGKLRIFDWISDGARSLEANGWTLLPGPRFQNLTNQIAVVHPEIEITDNQGDSLGFELSFQTQGGERIP